MALMSEHLTLRSINVQIIVIILYNNTWYLYSPEGHYSAAILKVLGTILGRALAGG